MVAQSSNPGIVRKSQTPTHTAKQGRRKSHRFPLLFAKSKVTLKKQIINATTYSIFHTKSIIESADGGKERLGEGFLLAASDRKLLAIRHNRHVAYDGVD